MPTLPNPRHERFAQLVHRYGNARRAYIEAGYKARKPRHSRESSPVDQAASRLSKHVKVKQRLSELAAMAQKRHEITVDTLLTDLEADRQLAHTSEQSGAAVSATMAKARLLGFIVDRKETGQPGDFAGMQSIQDVVALVAKELGPEAAEALAALVHQAPVAAQQAQADELEPAKATHEPSGTLN